MKCLTWIVFGVVVSTSPSWGQSTEQKQATVAWLRGLQNADGGFLTAPSGQSSLRATLGGLRALKYFGGAPQDREACSRFVAACFDKTTGGFRDQPASRAKPDVILTAVGLMAVVELEMPRDRYSAAAVRFLGEHAREFEDIRMAAAGVEAIGKRPPQADTWLTTLARMREPDGTFGHGDGAARATGGATAAILRLGGRVDHRDTILLTIHNGQRKDGGFGKEGQAGSDLESSYRVVRALVMLRDKPVRVEDLRRFVGRCRNADGGYAVAPGQPSTMAATYFAGILLHWLEGK
jgi:prenyltransferase beta subunit